METIKRFKLSNKKTVKSRMIITKPGDPHHKLDCVATGGSIVSTA